MRSGRDGPVDRIDTSSANSIKDMGFGGMVINPPVCPHCGCELEDVKETFTIQYEFRNIDYIGEEQDKKIVCNNCGGDVTDLFPDGVAGYIIPFADSEEYLSEVTGEGGESFGKGYFLRYKAWDKSNVPYKDISKCEAYAFVETDNVLEEWKREMDKNYYFLSGGYMRYGGVYGVTWAIFVKKK